MEPTNREQRRHPEKLEEPGLERPTGSPEEQMREQGRQQDDLGVRAKSRGHGKKTADEWNQ